MIIGRPSLVVGNKAKRVQVRDIIIYTVKNMASYANNHIKKSTQDINRSGGARRSQAHRFPVADEGRPQFESESNQYPTVKWS